MPRRDQRGYTKDNVVSGQQPVPANQPFDETIPGTGTKQPDAGADEQDSRSARHLADRFPGHPLSHPPGRRGA